jgi:hypothetical protein
VNRVFVIQFQVAPFLTDKIDELGSPAEPGELQLVAGQWFWLDVSHIIGPAHGDGSVQAIW